MFMTLMVPSRVAFDRPASSGLSAQVSRFRELVAPVHVLCQGSTLPVAGSKGAVAELASPASPAAPMTIMPSLSDLPYSAKQLANKGASQGVRPGVRSWRPPD